MAFWLVIGVLLLLSYVLWATADNRAAKRLGDEYDRYAAGAFKPIDRILDNGSSVIIRVAPEVVSKSGRRALLLDAPKQWDGRPRSTVVHEFNKNGTFSARGPYFISWYRGNWTQTGRKHLVEIMRAPKGRGFTASNAGGGSIPEIALRVVEWNTDKYHAVPPRNYDLRRAETREPEKGDVV
jgi:hypothetical protein